jgi:hypothetical protein
MSNSGFDFSNIIIKEITHYNFGNNVTIDLSNSEVEDLTKILDGIIGIHLQSAVQGDIDKRCIDVLIEMYLKIQSLNRFSEKFYIPDIFPALGKLNNASYDILLAINNLKKESLNKVPSNQLSYFGFLSLCIEAVLLYKKEKYKKSEINYFILHLNKLVPSPFEDSFLEFCNYSKLPDGSDASRALRAIKSKTKAELRSGKSIFCRLCDESFLRDQIKALIGVDGSD